MINIKQLIQVVPFPEDVKTQLLEQADSFSQDKKFQVEETCWSLISTEYQNRLKFEIQKMMLEMAQGEKTYTKEDFDKIENNLFNDLSIKLNAANDQEKINEIKEKLNIVSSQGANTQIDNQNIGNNQQ